MASGGLGEKSKHGQPTLCEILKEGAKFYFSKNEEKVKKKWPQISLNMH